MTQPRRTHVPDLRKILTDPLGWLALRSLQIILVATLAALIVVVSVQLRVVVVPVIIALILSAAIGPVVRWLKKIGVPNLLSTWITLIGGFGVFGGVVWLIVATVRSQWDELVQSATDGFEQLQGFLTTLPFSISEQQVSDIQTTVTDFLTSSAFSSGALAGVSVAAEVVTGAVLAFVILFFFLKDGKRMWEFLLKPFDGIRLSRGRRVGVTTQKVLGGYVRGTAIIALVDAVGIGVVLAIVQVPLALPLAVIVFIGAFVPIVGATVAGILAALVALVSNGPVVAIIVIIAVIAVNQLEGNLLQPVVMAQSLKLHPLIILVALTAGTVTAGIIGAILAVPLAAVVWAIAKTWNEPGNAPTPSNTSSSDRKKKVSAISRSESQSQHSLEDRNEGAEKEAKHRSKLIKKFRSKLRSS